MALGEVLSSLPGSGGGDKEGTMMMMIEGHSKEDAQNTHTHTNPSSKYNNTIENETTKKRELKVTVLSEQISKQSMKKQGGSSDNVDKNLKFNRDK